MIDFTELAQNAAQYLRPELLLLGSKAVESAATESGKQVVSWFRERLTGKAAKAALDDAAAHPDDDRRFKALRQQIEILLEDDEQFRADIEALLAHRPKQTSAHQVAGTIGDHNKVAQASGEKNKINIQ